MTRRDPIVGAVVTRFDTAEVVGSLDARVEGVGLRDRVCKPKNPLPELFALDEEKACAAINDISEESEHSNIAEKPSKTAPNSILRLGFINK